MSDVAYHEVCVCGASLTIGRQAGSGLLTERVRRWSGQHAACAHRHRRPDSGGDRAGRDATDGTVIRREADDE